MALVENTASLMGSFEESYYPDCMTELTLTAIFEEAEEGGYIGYVAELPGANTQGATLEETRENLAEAIQLILTSNREQFERNFSSKARVTREKLVLRAA
jgi:predicted RNase H-like HicB family nuclease